MSLLESFHLIQKGGYISTSLSTSCPYEDLVAVFSSNPERILIYAHITKQFIKLEDIAIHSLWVKTTHESQRIPFLFINSDLNLNLVNINQKYVSGLISNDQIDIETEIYTTGSFSLSSLFEGLLL
jgi:hypothetical protein